MTEIAEQQVGIGLLATLEQTGALTSRSLTLTDPDLPYERYEMLVGLFAEVGDVCRFALGDLLNLGESLYPDRYDHAAELTGLRVGTLMNYASVMRRVPRSRRRMELTFGHHEAVSKLEPEDQKRWLDAAIENRWPRFKLRDAIKEAGEAPAPGEQPQWTSPAELYAPPEQEVRVVFEDADGKTVGESASHTVTRKDGEVVVTLPSSTVALVEPRERPLGADDLDLAGAVRRFVDEAKVAEGFIMPEEDLYVVTRAALDALAALAAEE